MRPARGSSPTAPGPSTRSSATCWPSSPSRELGPDAAIPSERELMATYDVSRATVRKAIESLIADGLLHRIHGKGTFVARPRLESRLHLASFSQDMRRRGLTPSTRLLAVEADARRPTWPGRSAGRARHWPGGWTGCGSPTASRSRWRTAGTRSAPLPDLDRHDLSGSLYELFAERYGLAIDAAEQTLWGEARRGATARRLDAPVNTPLLVFRRVSARRARPLEYVVSRYRGDRYQIHMSLTNTNEGKNQ